RRRGRNPRGWWDWHAGKTALEFLWRTGELAVTRRESFQKVYDLAPRVLPPEAFEDEPDEPAFIDRACRSALDRLGFGTAGEIAGYWNLVTTQEAAAWIAARQGREVIEAVVGATDPDSRPRRLYARPDLEARLASVADPPPGLRALSPFDPVVRDRKRLRHLFGFDYRIEIFVAEAQRQYGYYVFPLLEGDRMVGRIDMTADRAAGVLNVRRLWPEPGVRFGAGRQRALEGLLNRISKFADCRDVAYAENSLPDC
ncbi:MAG: winged helix DNA-binding domain-containing protein, partial [Rhodospirillaceae bacterium]|nr:winged helix DNA-binding domain-containing protein [Rhodospirillaceae bacterium]